ncbi:MAG: aldo/keto reductase [Alphaproteobacteria bacterium]|nr:aldo/keto reductase [Alphaproteobacteria bacterium]
MQYTKLGRTDIDVSRICLGTMTWGTQNSESEGHQQMDYALERGVTFWDTAEMYPMFSDAESAGRTEQIIGTWLKKNAGRRSEIVLATKITGNGSRAVRNGRGIDGREIKLAIEGSLRRLQTDYVDLYQFHWPQRGSYHFQQQWDYRPADQDRDAARDNLLESLQSVGDLVREGKIRAFGVSDDTVWGVMELLRLSDRYDLPRVQSVQNEYSLLCRLFDTDWAEAAHYEDVGLLAWSPLAMGLLSGKYLGGETPVGSRKALMGGGMSRETKMAVSATRAYVEIARRHGLDPSQMAIAFTLARPFTTASIIGASRMDQLKTAIDAGSLKLSDEVMGEIGAVHRRYPMPY